MVFCRKKYLIFTSYHYFQGIFREMASADFCVLLSLVSLKKLCEFADVEGVKIPLNQRLQYNELWINHTTIGFTKKSFSNECVFAFCWFYRKCNHVKGKVQKLTAAKFYSTVWKIISSLFTVWYTLWKLQKFALIEKHFVKSTI